MALGNKSEVFFVVIVASVLLISVCRIVHRQYNGHNDCEMTYMYQWPQYQRVPLLGEVEEKYPRYSLHLYLESTQVSPKSLPLPALRGVPVLFLPGNAGSHKQARSPASIALRMHDSEFPHKRHFDFFTVNFDEELSGMFGGVLHTQTEYVAISIRHILSLYKHIKPRPQSVVIIGHSMGGVIAKGLFVDPLFERSSVISIIALSSPLLRPVLTFDPLLHWYYHAVEEVWSDAKKNLSSMVTIMSISGGERDIMVPTYLSVLPSSLSIASPAVPCNWASADHLAIVWCRRVQLALVRSLFLLQDEVTPEIISNASKRLIVFCHLLSRGKAVPLRHDTSSLKLDQRMVIFTQPDLELFQKDFVKGYKYAAVPLPSDDHTHFLLVASNTERTSWIYVCSESQGNRMTCDDISSLGHLLPPKEAVVKFIPVNITDLRRQGFAKIKHTHLLVARPVHKTIRVSENEFVLLHKCLGSSTLPLPWLRSRVTLPPGHCPLTNFSLPQLTQMWHVYHVEVASGCGGVAGGLVTPWYPHHSLLSHSPPSHSSASSLTLHLSLLTTPTFRETAHPHMLLWSQSQCELEVTLTFDPMSLLDKLAVVYAPFLLPWVTAVCITASCRALLWEVLALFLFCAVTSSGWLSQQSDWFGVLGSLWNGCSPVAIHLISCGLQRILYHLVTIITIALSRCGCGQSQKMQVLCWCLVIVGGATSMSVCSGLGLLLALIGFLVRSSGHGFMCGECGLKEVGCVLICLQVLTVPSIITWARSLRFALRLYPDPHVPSTLAAIVLTSLIMSTYPRSTINIATSKKSTQSPSMQAKGNGSENPINMKELSSSVAAIYWALGLAVIGYCLSHAYKMVGPVLVYLLVTGLTNR